MLSYILYSDESCANVFSFLNTPTAPQIMYVSSMRVLFSTILAINYEKCTPSVPFCLKIPIFLQLCTLLLYKYRRNINAFYCFICSFVTSPSEYTGQGKQNIKNIFSRMLISIGNIFQSNSYQLRTENYRVCNNNFM